MSDTTTAAPLTPTPVPAGSPAVAPAAAPTGRPRSRRGRARRWLGLSVPPFLLFLAIMGVWYLVSYVLLDPDRRFLLPPPHQVVQVAFLRW
ncbi:MAG TPA: hypothetical protein VEL73_01600, partial [Mycobacteriales bacterium]|nr:hypothetical protein [Mycobacteriales bacterium]